MNDQTHREKNDQIVIFGLSILVAGFLFTFITSFLVAMETIDEIPALGPLMCSMMGNGIFLTIIAALIIGAAKKFYHKVFPAGISAIIFLIMFLPWHVIALSSPNSKLLDMYGTPLMILTSLSIIPFLHLIMQTFININKYFQKRNSIKQNMPG